MDNTPAAETETTNAVDDLQARLKAATATKTPGAATSTNAKTNFWEASDDDFELPKKTEQKQEQKTEAAPGTEKTTAQAPPAPAITEKVKLGSAKTAAGMVDFTNRMLLTPVLNYKLKKKIEKQFTDEQLNLVESKLIEADEKTLDAEELRTKKRFDSILSKHQKKMDALPMDEAEKKELEDSFYNYFDYTQKSLSPGWYVAMAIINSTGRRIVDAFTE